MKRLDPRLGGRNPIPQIGRSYALLEDIDRIPCSTGKNSEKRCDVILASRALILRGHQGAAVLRRRDPDDRGQGGPGSGESGATSGIHGRLHPE